MRLGKTPIRIGKVDYHLHESKISGEKRPKPCLNKVTSIYRQVKVLVSIESIFEFLFQGSLKSTSRRTRNQQDAALEASKQGSSHRPSQLPVELNPARSGTEVGKRVSFSDIPSVTFLPNADDDSTDADYVKTKRTSSKQPDFVPVSEEKESDFSVDEKLSRDSVSQTETADVFTKVSRQESI